MNVVAAIVDQIIRCFEHHGGPGHIQNLAPWKGEYRNGACRNHWQILDEDCRTSNAANRHTVTISDQSDHPCMPLTSLRLNPEVLTALGVATTTLIAATPVSSAAAESPWQGRRPPLSAAPSSQMRVDRSPTSSTQIPGSAQRPEAAPITQLPALTVTAPASFLAGPYTITETHAATRTNTPLLKIPQSVQVIDRQMIQDQDDRTLADALVNVSGVVPSQPDADLFLPILIRGFPAEVYVDGLPLFGNAAETAPTSLVGVRRFAVLKGPNAALYGGGLGAPLGGLINVESEAPSKDGKGYVAMRIGSDNTLDPYFDVTGPLSSRVNFRIAGEYQDNESWIDQVHGHRSSLKPSLSFQLSPKTKLSVYGQFNRDSRLEYSGLPAMQALAGKLERNAFPGTPEGQPETQNKSQIVTVQLQHTFNDTLKGQLTGRYYHNETAEYGSFVYPQLYPPDPATPTRYPIVPLDIIGHIDEAAFDANVTDSVHWLGGTHRWLAGVNYDRTNFSSDLGFNGVARGTIDLVDPRYDLSFGPRLATTLKQTDRYRTQAAYVQDQATYGRLGLTGSLRLTQLQFYEKEQNTDQTYRRVSPRLGATFDMWRGISLFAGYATGFRGAFAFTGQEAPKPITSDNVSGGFKLALADSGLYATLAFFRQTRENMPTADPTHPGFSIQTGQQRAQGVEADLTWEPVPAFSLTANYAYTDAEVTRDDTIPVGERLARVPRSSGRLAARYRWLSGPAKGLSLGAGVTALGAREDTLPNTVSVPGYALIDAQAAYTFSRYSVQVSGVNLGDNKAFNTYAYLGFPVVQPVQPRSVYLTLKVNL
ncbi:TonB-dependent siderophore receptor [Salinisphaera sp. Q1T1-3]|uniref:TonB-dependent siderophore receptor n=1 Tax=Salinisphaera sp. Q1T1-3 TaxID=2321229 RepID=UPI000E720D46|nr:TonB-dependent siderophore receptor [Salinisphaera sp. Q1T1-3]RJS93683.1 TonB-dependent siderophore receptor [Salinisphaera sp. Q1T1-3]